MILNYTIKYKCFTEYIIVSTHRSYFTSGFIGVVVGLCIPGFLLEYKVKKLTVKIDIKTYTYDVN